jgi:ATP-dependent Lon protease
MDSHHLKLSPDQVRWRCSVDRIQNQSTKDIPANNQIVAQEDALSALRYGLEARFHGHNIYVRGLTGFGRMSLIRQTISEMKPSSDPVPDRCYVHNFTKPDQPRLITLPTGSGRAFRDAMDRFAIYVETELGDMLASDRIRRKQSQLEEQTQAAMQKIGGPFEDHLHEVGLAMVPVQVGPNVVPSILPVVDNKPVSYEAFQKMRTEGNITDEQFQEKRERIAEFEKKFADLGRDINQVQEQHRDAIMNLMHNEANLLIQTWLNPLRMQFPGDDVQLFLDELIEDLLDKRLTNLGKDTGFTRDYRANLVLNRAPNSPAPIFSETNPNLSNLVGKIDREFSQTAPYAHSDHLMIKPGALLLADGGFLILDARDLLMEVGAWQALIRTLKTGMFELGNADLFAPWAAPQLRPEPIPVNVKVILVGGPETFYFLDSAEPRFSVLFKVLADFSDTLERDQHGIDTYAMVISGIVQQDNLLHLSAKGITALIEHGARICGQRDRLTTRFSRIADIAREASFLATKSGHDLVMYEDVVAAIQQSRRRADIPARQFRRFLAEGTLKVAVSSQVVGQVNGLAVTQAGPIVYGFPSRITASIGPGSAGAINIERESNLSGAVHTKGFYILGGLLRHLLRVDHPMAFSASIAFEQTYGGIDGDSASAAEFCCLISALTDIPIYQNLAITGAIDQKGQILPVGATTQKIEGFYDACQSVGFDGNQGVVIPESNASELMLRDDVVEAVENNRFTVYAIRTIHEALSLLLGIPAGVRGDKGYPAGSILGIAETKTRSYWETARQSVN